MDISQYKPGSSVGIATELLAGRSGIELESTTSWQGERLSLRVIVFTLRSAV